MNTRARPNYIPRRPRPPYAGPRLPDPPPVPPGDDVPVILIADSWEDGDLSVDQGPSDAYAPQIAAAIVEAAGSCGLLPFDLLADLCRIFRRVHQAWPDHYLQLHTRPDSVSPRADILVNQEVWRKYERLAETIPGAYRRIEQVYHNLLLLLMMYGEVPIGIYSQSPLNPDLLGQVFVHLLAASPNKRRVKSWTPFFPAWLIALEHAVEQVARFNLRGKLESALRAAEQAAREAGELDFLTKTPDTIAHREMYLAWETVVLRHLSEPLVIGPEIITGPTVMLAVAGLIPELSTLRNIIRFEWGRVDPLIEDMMDTTAMMYGLNGHMQRWLQIWQQVGERDGDQPPRSGARHGYHRAFVPEQLPDPPETTGTIEENSTPPPGPSFADLFGRWQL